MPSRVRIKLKINNNTALYGAAAVEMVQARLRHARNRFLIDDGMLTRLEHWQQLPDAWRALRRWFREYDPHCRISVWRERRGTRLRKAPKTEQGATAPATQVPRRAQPALRVNGTATGRNGQARTITLDPLPAHWLTPDPDLDFTETRIAPAQAPAPQAQATRTDWANASEQAIRFITGFSTTLTDPFGVR